MSDRQFALEEESGMLDPKIRTAEAQAGYERNASSSPLLRLPPELRNMIYGFVLGDNKLLMRCYYGNLWGHQGWLSVVRTSTPAYRAIAPTLQLLAVCRQIYAEARMFAFGLGKLRSAIPNDAEAAAPWGSDTDVKEGCLKYPHFLGDMDTFAWAEISACLSNPGSVNHLYDLKGYRGLNLRIDISVCDNDYILSLEEWEIMIREKLMVWHADAIVSFEHCC